MTVQLFVDMDEYPGGSQEMAADATAPFPIAPLSRSKLGKNKNTALSSRPLRYPCAFSSRTAPSGWTSEGLTQQQEEVLLGSRVLIVRGNGLEVINRARLLLL